MLLQPQRYVKSSCAVLIRASTSLFRPPQGVDAHGPRLSGLTSCRSYTNVQKTPAPPLVPLACMPMEEADARFDEALGVILKAWTADEPFSHRGQYWQFDNIVVEPPTAQRPYPPIWMGAGSENSIRRVAAQGYCLLLGQYASPEDVAQNIAVYKSEVEARGRRFDPMQIGVTRAFFVAENAAEREEAMERRLANRVRQLKLATRPDGTVHGGPDRATGDPQTVNEISAMYGSPDEIPQSSTRCARRGSVTCRSMAAVQAAVRAAARACAALPARSCRPSPSGKVRHILIKIEAYHPQYMAVPRPSRRAGIRRSITGCERQEFVRFSLPDGPTVANPSIKYLVQIGFFALTAVGMRFLP
jgi:hypothetical protein